MNKKYKIKWDESFASGIKEIDDQHKDIIKCVNELYFACEENKIKENILSYIEQLDDYVTVHFEAEENYAQKYGFEKTDELLLAHKFFKDVYKGIKDHYTIYPFTNDLDKAQYKRINMFAIQLNQVLIEWLNVHIITIDKDLFDFIRGKLEDIE